MLPALALALPLILAPAASAPAGGSDPAAEGAVTVTASASASTSGSGSGGGASALPKQDAKPPKPTPEERLAQLDQRRFALGFGVRGYGRFLGGDPVGGAGVELGLGVRVIRGLYVQTKLDVGAHALPVGVAARGFVGLRHELRMGKWVRPSVSLGYSHLVEAQFDADWLPWEHEDAPPCGCPADRGLHAGAEVELASRGGIGAGLGLRFPFRKAPRLSVELAADAAYYFDRRPGRLQAGGSMGLSLVF